LKDATTDPLQIDTWWRQFPNALIGVPTGEAIGMWVLDIDLDVEKGVDGAAAWRALKLVTDRCLEPSRAEHRAADDICCSSGIRRDRSRTAAAPSRMGSMFVVMEGILSFHRQHAKTGPATNGKTRTMSPLQRRIGCTS
jgi:hypothetical protein